MGCHIHRGAQLVLYRYPEGILLLVAHVAEEHFHLLLRQLGHIAYTQLGLQCLGLQILLLCEVPSQQSKHYQGNGKIYNNMLHSFS